jgi:hypothetical protein
MPWPEMGGAGALGITDNPQICTTVVCSLLVCARGGAGPGMGGAGALGITDNPQICTTVVCSLLVCARGGAGPGMGAQAGGGDTCTPLCGLPTLYLGCVQTLLPNCWSRAK